MGPALLTALLGLSAGSAFAHELRGAVGMVRTTSSEQRDFVPSFKSGELLIHLNAHIRDLYAPDDGQGGHAPAANGGDQDGLLNLRGGGGNHWIRPFSRLDMNLVLSLDIVRPNQIYKNEYAIDMALLGLRSRPSHNSSREHGIGLFTGSDFYRPRFSSNTLSWNDSVDPRIPHAQFFTWRTAGLKTFHAIPAPRSRIVAEAAVYHVISENSSFVMHDLSIPDTECENKVTREEVINPVFLSKCNTRQNYYYSQGLYSEASLRTDIGRSVRIGIQDVFMRFRPLLEDEPVRDTINRLRGSLRWRWTEHSDVEIGGEHWTIHGRLGPVAQSGRWYSLWMAVGYSL